jgi:hypothetical protein
MLSIFFSILLSAICDGRGVCNNDCHCEPVTLPTPKTMTVSISFSDGQVIKTNTKTSFSRDGNECVLEVQEREREALLRYDADSSIETLDLTQWFYLACTKDNVTTEFASRNSYASVKLHCQLRPSGLYCNDLYHCSQDRRCSAPHYFVGDIYFTISLVDLPSKKALIKKYFNHNSIH